MHIYIYIYIYTHVCSQGKTRFSTHKGAVRLPRRFCTACNTRGSNTLVLNTPLLSTCTRVSRTPHQKCSNLQCAV